MTTVSTTMSGPIFDGSADRAVDGWVDDVEAQGATDLVRLIQAEVDVSTRRPTGRYRRKVAYDRRSDGAVVHDSRSVYGPWLEGTSRRNRTTRFKGYSIFRRTTQRYESDFARLADQEVDELVRKLDG